MGDMTVGYRSQATDCGLHSSFLLSFTFDSTTTRKSPSLVSSWQVLHQSADGLQAALRQVSVFIFIDEWRPRICVKSSFWWPGCLVTMNHHNSYNHFNNHVRNRSEVSPNIALNGENLAEARLCLVTQHEIEDNISFPKQSMLKTWWQFVIWMFRLFATVICVWHCVDCAASCGVDVTGSMKPSAGPVRHVGWSVLQWWM